MIYAVRSNGASDPNHEPPIFQGSLDIRFRATIGSPLADHGKRNVAGVPRARGRGPCKDLVCRGVPIFLRRSVVPASKLVVSRAVRHRRAWGELEELVSKNRFGFLQ
jgi:hypothetical protein